MTDFQEFKVKDRVKVVCTCCSDFWKGKVGRIESIDMISGRIKVTFPEYREDEIYFTYNEIEKV